MEKKIPLIDLIPLMSCEIENGGEVIFIPNGDSMEPTLHGGKSKIVLVKPRNREKCRSIVLYKRSDGSFVLHRIVGRCFGRYIMCGDAQNMLEYPINHSDLIGYVRGFYEGEKYIDCGKNIAYRMKSFAHDMRLWKKIAKLKLKVVLQKWRQR